MRKIVIVLAVVVLMVWPGLSGCSKAAQNNAHKGVSSMKQPAASTPMKEEEASAKKTEEENRNSAEEAKKIVVARVNGADISMYQLIRAMNTVAPKYVHKGEEPTPEITAKIRKEALDRLIFEELAVQQAKKEGLNPGPEAVDNVIKQVKKSLGTEQAYKDYLKKHDLTENELKNLIERNQRYQMITAKEIYRKVKVDEKLVRAEYEKEKSRYMIPYNFVVDDVFFLKGKGEATKKKAGQVLETIKKDNNDVWKLILDGTFIVRQIRVTKDRFPEIYKTMSGMKVGQLSGVIEGKDGFHIIKVEKKEPAHLASFKEAKPTIEARFLVPAQNKRKEEWENQLKKHAKIEIMSAKKAKK
jgi:PPIC-type PPIASE domain/SurA-like N-terminal domain